MLLIPHYSILLDQWQLGHGEDQRDRHDTEHLEIDPEIRREIPPNDFVDHSEHKEEDTPAECQLTPAFVRQLEGAVKNITQQ